MVFVNSHKKFLLSHEELAKLQAKSIKMCIIKKNYLWKLTQSI